MKPIRIALDANEANVHSRVGSNIYAYKLLVELEKDTRDAEDFFFTIYLSSPPQADFPQARVGWVYKVVTPSRLWTQWRYPIELFLHASSYDMAVSLGHYAPRFSPIPTVVCVLDLAFLQFPQFFRKKDLYQLTAWTRYSVANAKHIITISKNSMMDVIKEYRRAPEEISIVYPGVELPSEEYDRQQDEQTLKHFGVEKEAYIISLGTIQPRKNLISLVHAFERLKGKGVQYAELKLVFAGKLGWLTTEFEEIVAMSLVKDDIIVTGFVEEHEKYALLRHAKTSVLIGFYEGFGIPAIESMGVGVAPVVASTGSLPEVVGDYGVQVDPYSVDDITVGLETALARKHTHVAKEQLRDRARMFSWEKSGTQLVTVLKNIYSRLQA